MLLCWNTDMNVVVYSTSVAACADRPPTSTRHTLDSTVHPSMSSGLNQNAPAASRRSALLCLWFPPRHRPRSRFMLRFLPYTPPSYSHPPASPPPPPARPPTPTPLNS